MIKYALIRSLYGSCIALLASIHLLGFMCLNCDKSSGRPIITRPLEIKYVCCPITCGNYQPKSKIPALNEHKQLITFKPYGYIKLDVYYDSRQVIGSRDNQVVLFPAPYRPDIFGQDINSRGGFQMSAIETRAGVAMTGPQWCTLKTDGLIEIDFRGQTELTNGCARLRHAYGTLIWDTGSFIFGQFWHPLFVPECYPHTVNFNYGSPFDPQARQPQLRVTQRWNNVELIVAGLSQRDFQSNGPFGLSTTYMRNALTPNWATQLSMRFGEHIIGATFDYKRLVPRIVTDKNIKVVEQVNSIIVQAFAAFNHAPISLRMKVIYAENGNDHVMISGFGIRTIDPVTDFRTYSPTAAISTWLDGSYTFHCDTVELGAFIAYTKNIGSRDRLYIDPSINEPIIYALADISQKLDYVGRISPRVAWAHDPFRIGFEFEFLRAAYGTINSCGRINNARAVNNIRLLGAFYYVF